MVSALVITGGIWVDEKGKIVARSHLTRPLMISRPYPLDRVNLRILSPGSGFAGGIMPGRYGVPVMLARAECRRWANRSGLKGNCSGTITGFCSRSETFSENGPSNALAGSLRFDPP